MQTEDPQKPKPKPVSNTTAKADATRTASKIPAVQPKLKVNDGLAHFNVAPRDQGTITSWPPPQTVNYQDLGNPTTSLAMGTNVLNTYGAISGVSELKAAVSAFSAARNSSTIFRAVSGAEAADIANFGVRNTSGAYETGKLFAPTWKKLQDSEEVIWDLMEFQIQLCRLRFLIVY